MVKTKDSKERRGIPSHYRDHLNKIVLLSDDEVRRLGEASMAGDLEARKVLIEKNLLLVVSLANLYRGQTSDLMDLIQAGNIGLIKAADKFDPSLSKFSTYAHIKIRSEIIQAIIRDICSRTGITNSENQTHRQLSVLIKTLTNNLGYTPEKEEIIVAYSAFMEISEDETIEYLSSNKSFWTSSETSISPEETISDSQAVDPEEAVIELRSRNYIKDRIEIFLSKLKDPESAIFKHYMSGMN